jgi:hypothetical protein
MRVIFECEFLRCYTRTQITWHPRLKACFETHFFLSLLIYIVMLSKINTSSKLLYILGSRLVFTTLPAIFRAGHTLAHRRAIVPKRTKKGCLRGFEPTNTGQTSLRTSCFNCEIFLEKMHP